MLIHRRVNIIFLFIVMCTGPFTLWSHGLMVSWSQENVSYYIISGTVINSPGMPVSGATYISASAAICLGC